MQGGQCEPQNGRLLILARCRCRVCGLVCARLRRAHTRTSQGAMPRSCIQHMHAAMLAPGRYIPHHALPLAAAAARPASARARARQVTTQHLLVSKEHGGESQEDCDVSPVEYDPQWPIVIAKLKKCDFAPSARTHARTHAPTHARMHARTLARSHARVHTRTHLLFPLHQGVWCVSVVLTRQGIPSTCACVCVQCRHVQVCV